MIRPLNDFIYLRLEPKTITSSGGILLGEEKKPDVGVVVAVGPGKKTKRGHDTMWGIEPGQRLVFSPNGRYLQKVDGEELVVIRRDSVIGLAEASL